jgi:hypothetical protein
MKNLGPIDRILRALLGLGILGLYGALDAPAKYFTLLGLIPFATALTGHCPVYRAMNIQTLKKETGHARDRPS